MNKSQMRNRVELSQLKMIMAVALLCIMSVGLPSVAQEVGQICGTPKVSTLYAGQTTIAGTVTVSNDEDNLYVTFLTFEPWWLSETHLHVDDSLASIPQTKKGNPKIGNFEYQMYYDPPAVESTYTIAKSSLDTSTSIVIAAHAAVVQIGESGDIIEAETGWADGQRFVDRGSWATFFEYTWQSCDGGDDDSDSGTETAFAFAEGISTCFLDIDEDSDGVGDFNRWGWTIGPLPNNPVKENGDLIPYEFDIYAGAGRCSLSSGTFVGKLYVVYDASGSVVVNFDLTETDLYTGLPYSVAETHVYVGPEILARNVNNEFTVAPGQYPSIGTWSTHYFRGLTGDIYVVAHATVAGFPPED